MSGICRRGVMPGVDLSDTTSLLDRIKRDNGPA